MRGYHTVAKLGDLAPGEIRALTVAGAEVILYRSGDDYFAAERYCVHQHADLSAGEVAHGYLVCRLHGWRFDAATGVHEYSPMTCLRTYDVRIVGDDIQIDPTPKRQGAAP
ncbi:Rieske (2Fe-2S) protein [Haliangium sp.]|uniref:Rieske (2Fe-2S) protein n=1 Tax=Haliangium sp. TaxID=2663208 RepID=UPI003D0B28C6